MGERNNIPADLVEEILYLLPSNDLLNFKRVCKDWKHLISCQRFIQKHLYRSKGTLIFMLSRSGILVFDDPIRKKICKRISYPPRFSVYNTRIAGSCDGLVCLVRAKSKEFAIINPSTGKFDIRRTDGFVFDPQQSFWFGQHPSTGEYLFIALILMSSSRRTRVYQFSSNPALSSIPQTAYHLPLTAYGSHMIPILLHGVLHWPIVHYNVRVFILAYDIQKNKFREIISPFRPPFDVRLGIVDGCLFVIIRTGWGMKFELWIMKEYGVEESWTKHCNIEGVEEYMVPCPLGFLADDDLLLNIGNKKIVKYSLSDKKATVVHWFDAGENVEAKSAILCGDSLVTPSLIWPEK